MDATKVVLHEMDTLRHELQHLKLCQVRYFLFSITVTGALVGTLSRSEASSHAMYLAPLIVVIPCWWIFFDKAATITRIVGYYRLLEMMLTGEGRHRYCGWERALADFRRWQEDGRLKSVQANSKPGADSAIRLLRLNSPHRYWVINWYTFLMLSLVCITLSASSLGFVSMAAVVAVVGWSAYANFCAINDLVFGDASYDANEKYWVAILAP